MDTEKKRFFPRLLFCLEILTLVLGALGSATALMDYLRIAPFSSWIAPVSDPTLDRTTVGSNDLTMVREFALRMSASGERLTEVEREKLFDVAEKGRGAGLSCPIAACIALAEDGSPDAVNKLAKLADPGGDRNSIYWAIYLLGEVAPDTDVVEAVLQSAMIEAGRKPDVQPDESVKVLAKGAMRKVKYRWWSTLFRGIFVGTFVLMFFFLVYHSFGKRKVSRASPV